MKSDKLLSFSLMPSSVISTALSVAVSVAIGATLLAPEGAFAASQDAAPAKTAKAKKATKKVAKAEPETAKVTKKAAATRTVAAKDDDARPVAKKRRVTYTMNGRHHSAVRRVAFEPRQPTVGQAFGLHDSPDSLMLRSGVAYVVDQNTLEPLFDKNSRAVVPIASISKLMTAMVVLDSKESLSEQIEVTDEDRDYE